MSFIRDLLPPILARAIRPRRYGLFGDFPTWGDALKASAPYQTDLAIFGAMVEGMRANPVIGATVSATLAGLAQSGPVQVLDFGGNLGMGYFRSPPGAVLAWHVVDLQAVVEYGQRFADSRLSFHTSIADVPVSDVVICDAVLNFLEYPYSVLADLAAVGARMIILDRNRMFMDGREKVTVQRNYDNIGGGVRPFRVLSKAKVMAALSDYELVAEVDHNAPDPGAPEARYLAQVYRKR